MCYLWYFPADIQVGGGGGSAGYSRASIGSPHYQHYACYLCQPCILTNIISDFENQTWYVHGLFVHSGTLYSQNGGGTNPGGVLDKADNAIKLVRGLVGVMDMGWVELCV